MKLSISNIAWNDKYNTEIYKIMHQENFYGLEIAPTKIFAENPYNKIEEAKYWFQNLKAQYNFEISSMQSIWYGKNEKIFGSKMERQLLIDYTKKAIDFAFNIECKNLVFGCPKNRNITDEKDLEIAIKFFKELGDYAYSANTCIGMEANPTIYNTNFINDTTSALNLIKQVDSAGFKLNLDIGTIIHNNENIELLSGNVHLINHVHVSEPYLELIKERKLHKQIVELLKQENYQNFISIEMKQQEKLDLVKNSIIYLKGLL